MSLISDTDVHTFSALVNPQKTRLTDLQEDFMEGRINRRMGGSRVSEEDECSEASTNDHNPRDAASDPRYSPAREPSLPRETLPTRAPSVSPPRSESRTPSPHPPASPRTPSPGASDHDSRIAHSAANESRYGRPASRISRPASVVSATASHFRTPDVRSAPASETGERLQSYPPSDDERHTEVESVAQSQNERRRVASETGSRRSRVESVAPHSNRFTDFISHNRNPHPRSESARHEDATLMHEKQNVLMDMSRLKMQGIQFSKEWTTDDSLDDMQYEVRRHMIHIEEINNMKMMRDGMRMICTGIEMLNGRMQILELNGWAADVCSDMSKYDPALSKLYRKYWRKSQSASPEMEIATGVLMSMGMYHFKRKLATRMFPGPNTAASSSATASRNQRVSSPVPSDTSSEDMPP